MDRFSSVLSNLAKLNGKFSLLLIAMITSSCALGGPATTPVVLTPTIVGSKGTPTPTHVVTISAMTDLSPSIPPGPQG